MQGYMPPFIVCFPMSPALSLCQLFSFLCRPFYVVHLCPRCPSLGLRLMWHVVLLFILWMLLLREESEYTS